MFEIKGLKNNLKMVASSALITVALGLSTPVSAAILNVQNNVLIGASGVNVSGILYDVEFLDGSYTSIFGNAPLTFTTTVSANTASQALLDQVFLNGGAGQFDDITTTPQNYYTRGCTSNAVCNVYTPGSISGSDTFNQIAINNAGTAADTLSNIKRQKSFDTTPYDYLTYAKWTVTSVAAVPEPSTYAMMSLGLFAIMWMSRRRQNNV